MKIVLAIVVAVSLAAGTLSVASAADEKKANPQQERMKACNCQAGDKIGRGAQGVHVQLSQGRRPRHAHDPAGEDEELQYGRERQVPQG